MSLYTFLYKGQVYDTVTVDNVASAVNSSVLVTTVVVSPAAANPDTACDDP